MSDMEPNELLPRNWNDEPIDRPLVDDLANVLACTVVGWSPDLSEAPEVKRVLARYRASRDVPNPDPDVPTP